MEKGQGHVWMAVAFSVVLVLVHHSVGASAQDNPYCPASNCASNQTCCYTDFGDTSCCDHANATCCGYQSTCCPNGLVCDPIAGSCIEPNKGSYCQPCEQVVQQVISKGCHFACGLLPSPADYICEFILQYTDLCGDLLNWTTAGFSPQSMCMMMGFCSGGTCTCGYCTQYQYGRCLSFPNHCPTNVSASDMLTTTAFEPIPNELFKNKNVKSDICFNGICQMGLEGCCLTCF